MKEYLIARLKEASTWRGLILIGTSLGISLTPEQMEAVVVAGLALAGAAGAFFPDKE